jgi:Ubiquitin family
VPCPLTAQCHHYCMRGHALPAFARSCKCLSAGDTCFSTNMCFPALFSRATCTRRQRIIFRGRVLADGDTLTAAHVEPGSVLHLFQRPKDAVPRHHGAAAAASGHAAALHQSHPEMPSLVIGSVHDYQYSESAWALEAARRGLRLLSYCLFLISSMQVSVCA